MGIAEIVTGLVAFGSFTAIFFIMKSRAAKQEMQERLKSVAAANSGDQPKGLNPNAAPGASAMSAAQPTVSELLSLPAAYNKSEYKVMFEQAGWNPRNATQHVLMIKAALILGAVLLVGMSVVAIPKLAVQPVWLKLLMVAVAGLIGMMMFDMVMKKIIQFRYNRISHDLHSAVELLVVCSRAGMGVDKAMERVAKEIGLYNPDLGRELMTTSIELEIMPNRRIAYENLKRRIGIPLIQGMATTLMQAEEQGTSVSESLQILSEEFRSQVLLEFERKAAKLPATLSIPVVVFTLPTLLAVILGPAIINLMSESGGF